MTKLCKKILAALLVAITLMVTVEIVSLACDLGRWDTSVAEGATKKTASKQQAKKSMKKTTKSTKSSSVAQKVVPSQINTSADVAVVLVDGGKYYPEYGCTIGILSQNLKVTDNITVINRKTGKTVKTGTTVSAKTEVKVFVKYDVVSASAPQSSTRKVENRKTVDTRKVDTVKTTATKVEDVVETAWPKRVLDSRYSLTFASLASCKDKVVNGNEVVCEDALSLVGTTFNRNPSVPSQLTFRLERALQVPALELAYVTVFPSGNRKSWEAKPGQTLKKGTVITWMFRNAQVCRQPERQPKVSVAKQVPVATKTVAIEPVAVPAPDYGPEYIGTVDAVEERVNGFRKDVSGAFFSFQGVREPFAANPDWTIFKVAKDGSLIPVDKDATGTTTIGGSGEYRVYTVRVAQSNR